jgi:AmmeMemoRadiSam system protein A
MYTQEQKQVLVTAARSSIQHGLQSRDTETINVENYDPELQEIRATFVTLKIEQALRGCIGTLEAKYPLIRSVTEYAYAAAFRDPRFKPLSQDEYEKITLSISILTPAEVIKFNSESDLINQLVPNIDGLIIKSGNRSATFLPAVWESLPHAEKFLSQLKAKAQIGPDENLTGASRYKAIEICEKDF